MKICERGKVVYVFSICYSQVMAKETCIIFIYDTKYVQKEEDDPAKAILYFHPTWVSDQQKYALCGQIIGTYTCTTSIFSKPKIISLQTGKFYIIENGRYILAVGTDRNIMEWLLEFRAKTLYSLVNFFHKDFETLSTFYLGDSLSAKLYHIFETYLKMLMFNGNIFSHIPTLLLPKSASNVFMEAVHILECCQELNNVLGGSMMYHNKVVATQLSANLTKRLVIADPYRIKSPAEIVEVSYELPLGVQLLQVYITNTEYCKLFESSSRNRNIFQYLSNKSMRKSYSKATQPHQEPHIISAMKRDQSLLFTAVPEEDSDQVAVTSDQIFISTTKKSRPKFLNLKSISIESNSDSKSTKPAPGTPFCGQRSVCSTPMTELKKFVHMKPLSICKNNEIIEEKDPTNDLNDTVINEEHTNIFDHSNSQHEVIPPKEEIPESNVMESEMKTNIPGRTNDIYNGSASYLTISSNSYKNKKYASQLHLTDLVNSISKHSTQYFNNKIKAVLDITSPLKKRNLFRHKSIIDPTFPVEKQDGTAISRCYYNECVAKDLEMVQNEVLEFDKGNKREAVATEVFQIDESSKGENKKQPNNEIVEPTVKINKEHRKSLTLPLKSLTTDLGESVPDVSSSRRYSMGVQLTPLMSKLSMLAFEERSSGFCSRDTTPGDYRGFTPTQGNASFPFGKLKTNKDILVNNLPGDALQKCVLFVCGQQDVVLMMLLREEACNELEVIKKLWDICTEHLGKLEKQLIYCMESQSGTNSHETEPYSYLCLDSEWDTVKRGGPWGTGDLGMLDYLHGNFANVPNLTEIIVRGSDNVIYAHHCGPTEIFYHESANPTAGLPPPADPMGLVQLKAKRRLERDHAIILL